MFWSLFVPNVISPSCHFVLIKFPMGSNMVSNLHVFPNMLSIAPHLCPICFAPICFGAYIAGKILGPICFYVYGVNTLC
jgi:hypothetical protein